MKRNIMELKGFVDSAVVGFLSEGIDRQGVIEISLHEAIKMSQISDINDIGEWLSKDIEDINFYYKKEPITMFEDTIQSMESTYDEFIDELHRTEHILELLESGSKPMPIFVELNDKSNFIMEGRHRIVAFSWFGLDNVPVIYVQ